MENENTSKKDTTKEKIILFVIGLLLGALISTASFFAYAQTLGVNNASGDSSAHRMPDGTPPEMPAGDQNDTPPEMSEQQNGQDGKSKENTDSQNENDASSEKQGNKSKTSKKSDGNSKTETSDN